MYRVPLHFVKHRQDGVGIVHCGLAGADRYQLLPSQRLLLEPREELQASVNERARYLGVLGEGTVVGVNNETLGWCIIGLFALLSCCFHFVIITYLK